MKTKLVVLAILAGGSMFAQTRFSIGVNLGGSGRGYYTQAPPAYASVVPPCPGPDYFWTDGYYTQSYGRNAWVNGFWARRPYNDAYRVAPRYNNSYAQHDFNRGYEQNRSRDFNQSRNRDDDNNRGRGNQQNSRSVNGYGNGFRNR